MRETVKTFCFDEWGRIPLVHEKGDPGWRYNNGKKPGWGMSGGGPEYERGETSSAAAVRETKEESGLITQPKKKLFSEPVGDNHEVAVWYSAIVGGSLKKESQETDNSDWFFYDELPENPADKLQSIYPAEKRRIKKVIEILGIEEELKWLKWYFLTKEEEKNAVKNEVGVRD